VFSISQSAQCSYGISPTEVTVGETATSGTVSVSAGAGCTWQASSTVSWLTVTSGSSGTGSGGVGYSVAANSSGAPRIGTLNIAGNVFTVNQSSCGYTVTPSSVAAGAGGTNSAALVRTGASCSWSATSDSSWVTFTSATTGSGTAWVTFRIAAYSGTTTRTGTVTIGREPVNVTQSGTCAYSVAPLMQTVAAAGGPGTVTLTTSTGCGWVAFSNAAWITINTGSTSGSASATVTFTVAPNTGTAPRTGTIRVGGITATITQSGAASLTTPTGLKIIGPD
jgi:hypothetical protein